MFLKYVCKDYVVLIQLTNANTYIRLAIDVLANTHISIVRVVYYGPDAA